MKYLALLLALVLPLSGQTLTNTTLDGVTNATINGKLDDDVSATHAALNLGTAATATLSTNGGAGNVAQFDSNGNLTLRPLRTLADTGGIVTDGGNLILTDRQQVGWYASDSSDGYGPTGAGKFLFRIRQDNGHPYETNFDASGSICFYWGESTVYRGMQFGNAQGGSHFMYRSSGDASSGTTMRQSVPDAYNTSTWTGGVAVRNRLAIQAAPLDLSGTNSAFHFYRNNTLGSAQAADGVLFATIAPEGVWSAGTAPAFKTLTAASGIFTQTCSKYRTVQIAKFTLNSAASLAISGAENGMRGVIYITQGTAGTRTLTLPTSSVKATDFALSTTSGLIDRLEWEYDGSSYYWTITKGLLTSLDSDADAYLVRQGGGSITATTTEQLAVNALVLALKSGTLWGKTVAAYPFIGAAGGPQGENLKADTYDITWSGGGHTFASATGVTGNGSTAFGNTGINLSTLSRQNNVAAFAYARTSSPTDNGYFFGATDANGRIGMYRSGTAIYATGPCDQGAGQIGSTDSVFATDMAVWRDASSTKGSAKAGTTYYPTSQASTAAPNQNIYLFARNNTGTAAGFSNASLGFFWVGDSLTEAEYAELRGYCASYQTALGRANP